MRGRPTFVKGWRDATSYIDFSLSRYPIIRRLDGIELDLITNRGNAWLRERMDLAMRRIALRCLLNNSRTQNAFALGQFETGTRMIISAANMNEEDLAFLTLSDLDA